MSRSCQSATFSIAGSAMPRTSRARPVRFSVSTGLRLCGIAEEPFWPGEKNSSRLQHLGALHVADLGGDVLDRRGDDAERGEEHRVPVARDHLGRDRLGRQAHLRADMLLDRADRCWRRCRPRPRSRRSRFPRARVYQPARGRAPSRHRSGRRSGPSSSARHGCRGSGRCGRCPCARRRGASAPPAARRYRRAGCRRRGSAAR